MPQWKRFEKEWQEERLDQCIKLILQEEFQLSTLPSKASIQHFIEHTQQEAIRLYLHSNTTSFQIISKSNRKIKSIQILEIDMEQLSTAFASTEEEQMEWFDLSLLSNSTTTIPILFQDEHLAVIEKPRGVMVHPISKTNKISNSEYKQIVNQEITLVHYLLHLFGRDHLSRGELELNQKVGIRPGIVHRLDRDTSGLMVIAKSDDSHEQLKQQFATHTSQRKYFTIVCYALQPLRGTIDKPIGAHPKHTTKQCIDERHGKQAITHYTVLYTLSYHKSIFSVVECVLETGRTHQIRVHLASLHRPIVGDCLYGSKQIMEEYPSCVTFENEHGSQYLHAYSLEFVHPVSKQSLSFTTPFPSYFEDFFKECKKI